MSNNNAFNNPVLIVGAGPTGLTLANALAKFQVPFTIVDSKSGPSSESKGLALNVVSQYGFELLGLKSQIGKDGCRVRRLNVLWEGKRLNAIDFCHLDFHIDTFITQPQADTEMELVEALSGQGHTVNWCSRLVDITPHANFVEAQIEDSAGKRTCQVYNYVVSCEGKRSIIRERIGVQLSGSDYPMYFVLGDFELSWETPPDQVYYYVYESTFIIFVPISATHWRIVVKYDGDPPVDTPLRVEEISTIVDKYLGAGLIRSDALWMSRAPFYLRTADHLRKGRILLAGDAAHLYSPIGGTGMNTGMQDAMNLAWKLALVHHGSAKEFLLDSYESERLETINITGLVTDHSTRLIGRVDREPAAVAHMIPSMKNRAELRTMPLKFSGLAGRYIKAFEKGCGKAMPGSRSAGEMCLGRVAILDLLGKKHPEINPLAILGIVYLNSVEDKALIGRVVELSDIMNACKAESHTLVIASQDCASELRAMSDTLYVVNEDADLCRRIGIVQGGLMLVYADGTIGFSASIGDVNVMREMMELRFKFSSGAANTVSETDLLTAGKAG